MNRFAPARSESSVSRRASPPHRWRFAALLALALMASSALAPSMAAARSRLSLVEDGRGLLHSYSATMGLTYNRSGDFNAWSTGSSLAVEAVGFRYYERNGFITGTILGILRIFTAAVAASGPKSSTSWTEGNLRYTRTTYYSEAEKQAMQRSASNSAANMMSSPGQSFDLEIYSRNLGGDASGYKLTMMMGGMKLSGRGARAKGMLEIGMGFGSVKSGVASEGKYLITEWDYVGIPFRLTYALGPINLYGLWEWNWLGHSRGAATTGSQVGKNTRMAQVAGFPLRIGVTAALLQRVYVEAAATTPSPTSGVFGFVASAGARF